MRVKSIILGLAMVINASGMEHEQAFTVVGIQARTSNAQELAGHGVIAKLWQRFFAEKVKLCIPHKVDNDIVGLYYDFASDKDGEYTLLIGVRVNAVDEVPEGMVVQHVPEQKMAIFTSERGPVFSSVLKTWRIIWRLEDEKKIDRTYKYDYELYGEKSQNPDDGQVNVYIGVR